MKYTYYSNSSLHCNKRLVACRLGTGNNLFYSVLYCLNVYLSSSFFLYPLGSHKCGRTLFFYSSLIYHDIPFMAIFSPYISRPNVYTYILVDAGLRAYISPGRGEKQLDPYWEFLRDLAQPLKGLSAGKNNLCLIVLRDSLFWIGKQ